MLLPFLGLVTHWLGGKDVLFEEFGAPTSPRDGRQAALSRTPLLAEEEAAQYTQRSLAALQCFGMTGAMLWCFGDYDEKLWSEPPLDEAVHERFFGLWRSDHSAKPALQEIERMSGAERHMYFDDLAWLDVSKEEFYQNPRLTLRHLYRSFLRSPQDALKK
jgi:hypothetical protein